LSREVLLYTGFEKFLKHKYNPSEMLAQRLNDQEIGNLRIVGEVIPLRYYDIPSTIRQLIDKHNPDALIMSGLAGRNCLSIEKLAINYANSRGSPYNCGSKPAGEILQEDGAAAYFSKLPIADLIKQLRKKGIPVEESLSAGSYGCNQIFYEAMYYLDLNGYDIPAGFIHVPHIPAQATKGSTPSLPFELQLKGMTAIIEYLSKWMNSRSRF